MLFWNRPYTLKKSHHIFLQGNSWYRKNWKQLDPDALKRIEYLLAELDSAVSTKDKLHANQLAHEVEIFGKNHFKRAPLRYLVEVVIAIAVALCVATVIRQMWFEPYKIPSGSMRPTFREQDHLLVSKTAFALNVPLRTEHFLFEPKNLQRGGVVIWTGDNIDLPDTDTTYFYLFPGKKRYIKRLMGKPGDSLYFYGGKVYGIDKDGNDITSEYRAPYFQNLEYLPFLNFRGRDRVSKMEHTELTQVYFKQVNQDLCRLTFLGSNLIKGDIYNGKEWIKDNPGAQKQAHDSIKTYSDFFGIRNFAMARLLTKEQLKSILNLDPTTLEDGVLYLELMHSPSLTYPVPSARNQLMGTQSSVIALQHDHLNALMNTLYTDRFIVKNGRATSYRGEDQTPFDYSPAFPGIPDGMYEFYYGKGYEVGSSGWLSSLPADHPLYSRDPENIQRLFNYGIEPHLAFEPRPGNSLFPNRYAYFRKGDLDVMGGPVFRDGDPILASFVQKEMEKQEKSSDTEPYIAFHDYGPPLLKNGSIDKQFIRTFGVNIPEGHYLVLGDNHAVSMDSRYFGFLPAANLQGEPLFIFWPPGPRWGFPSQAQYPWVTIPSVIVWTIALLAWLVAHLYHRRNMQQQSFKKVS